MSKSLKMKPIARIMRTLQRCLASAPAPAKRRKRLAERGMTLVEIMVVVVIIGLVTSLVGVAVFSQLEEAKIHTGRTQMKNISDALDLYRLSHRKYPSTGEGLAALTQSSGRSQPVMPAIPRDPWGNDYVYIFPGTKNSGGFDIMSYGSDGVQGGGDDIFLGETEGQ